VHVCCVLGDEEVDDHKKIRLRDDVIFQLKQQIATQQQRIGDLEHVVNELSQIPIKEEGMSILPTIASCLFNVCVRIITCRR
jgi:succinylarginine dihydrolase